MNERRRFLQVLGGSVLALGASPIVEGCGGDAATNSTGNAGSGGTGGGAGGAGGTGATGGAGTGGDPADGGCVDAGTQSGTGACGIQKALIAVGTPDLYATPGLHKVPGTKVLIGRDAGGLYSLSALCSHKCCNMNGTSGSLLATGIKCKCHNSTFDDSGVKLTGPGTLPLPAYQVSLECDGVLYVDTRIQVSNTVRLAV